MAAYHVPGCERSEAWALVKLLLCCVEVKIDNKQEMYDMTKCHSVLEKNEAEKRDLE